MNVNSAKGVLFEEIVKMLLKKNEYEECNADEEQIKCGRVRGRGGWHQIDAWIAGSSGSPDRRKYV